MTPSFTSSWSSGRRREGEKADEEAHREADAAEERDAVELRARSRRPGMAASADPDRGP